VIHTLQSQEASDERMKCESERSEKIIVVSFVRWWKFASTTFFPLHSHREKIFTLRLTAL